MSVCVCMPVCAVCVCVCVSQVPRANSLWDSASQSPVPAPSIDISVAVATDKGLITPIVKNADSKSVVQVCMCVCVCFNWPYRADRQGTRPCRAHKSDQCVLCVCVCVCVYVRVRMRARTLRCVCVCVCVSVYLHASQICTAGPRACLFSRYRELRTQCRALQATKPVRRWEHVDASEICAQLKSTSMLCVCLVIALHRSVRTSRSCDDAVRACSFPSMHSCTHWCFMCYAPRRLVRTSRSWRPRPRQTNSNQRSFRAVRLPFLTWACSVQRTFLPSSTHHR